ncbi:hypothetical protein [Micromonospora sp. LOL_024]|uniref:hypothetical protein n=1 Tax=Micromonospora sp. LOL_024 TaxID=3345412 RepID=UPI003A86EC11
MRAEDVVVVDAFGVRAGQVAPVGGEGHVPAIPGVDDGSTAGDRAEGCPIATGMGETDGIAEQRPGGPTVVPPRETSFGQRSRWVITSVSQPAPARAIA